MRGHLHCLLTGGGHGFKLGGGIRLRRLDEDLTDVGEADETEDVFQILALLIPDFRAGTGAIRAAARIDGYQRFAGDEPFVALLWREAERQPSMDQQIDVVLQLIRNAEIPHRQRDQIFVGRFEVVSDTYNGPPDVELFRRVRLAMLDGVGGFKRGAVDLGKIGLPEIERFDGVAGMRYAIGLDEAGRDSLRC
jgi:hypothetical protein